MGRRYAATYTCSGPGRTITTMDNPLEDGRWVTEKWNELWVFLRDADVRGDAAAKRHQELVNVHREGWRHLSDTLGGGVKLIAEAIRDHGRR